MAAPAQLETSVIGTGSHSTYGGVFDHLPQGIDYTLSTKFEYDTDSIEVDSGLTRVSGAMGFTVVAGDQTVSFNSGGIPSYGYLRSETLNNADGYNNALRLDHLFYLPGDSYYFEVSYTISWRDGTAAPSDFLTAPQTLLAGDDYHLTSSVVANWFDERAGNLYVNTREGNLSMTMVPEPSAAVMLLGGLGAGFLVRSRRRPAPVVLLESTTSILPQPYWPRAPILLRNSR